MPEISQADLDALQARAEQAPANADPAPAAERKEQAEEVKEHAQDAPPEQTVTISKADLDRLIAEASKGGQVPGAEPEPEPLPPTHVAMLATGERFEYSGAHPTHVRDADGVEAQVVASFPLPPQKPDQGEQNRADQGQNEHDRAKQHA
jgi:hypothetical protein